MLKRLNVENFKSWKRAEVEFAPLTAFFGANSSGKSSLIQFLLLLKQTKDSPDRSLALDFGSEESPVDLGSFREAIHKNDETLSLTWTLNWQMPEVLRIADPTGKRTDVLFEGGAVSLASSASWRGKSVIRGPDPIWWTV